MDGAWRSWIPEFDRMAPTYDEAVRDPWIRYEAAWAFVERSLRAGLGHVAGRSVVDVGCGTGEFVARLAALSARPIGIEPSAGMREAARAKMPAAAIADGHLGAIPLADGAADAAIATYVVSHLGPAEQPGAIAELLRVVAPGGPIVVVDVPTVAPADMPRVREVLRRAGKVDQIPWFEAGSGLDLVAWCSRLEASGRRVTIEPLGPLLVGLAAPRA